MAQAFTVYGRHVVHNNLVTARSYNIASDFWLKNPTPPQPNPTGNIDFLEYRIACVLIQNIIFLSPKF